MVRMQEAPGSVQKENARDLLQIVIISQKSLRYNNISRILNIIHCKSIYMHHKRRCADILSIHNQESKKTKTRLLAVHFLTCLFQILKLSISKSTLAQHQ
jgi:hypothetical protein